MWRRVVSGVVMVGIGVEEAIFGRGGGIDCECDLEVKEILGNVFKA